MPELIIITEDDKRIRELVISGSLLLSDVVAVDRTGWPEARQFTFQQVADLLSTGAVKQFATSGTVNPDNAAGAAGDFYFKTGGDQISLFQKIGSAWSNVFSIALAPLVQPDKKDVFSQTALSSDGFGGAVLSLGYTGTKNALSVVSKNAGGTTLWTLPGGANQSVITGVDAAFLEVPQTITVFYVGEAAEAAGNTATISNFSSDPVVYRKNEGSDITLNSGQEATEIMSAGDHISVTMDLDTQACTQTIYNSDNSIFYGPNTVLGPSTINGVTYSAGRRQTFVIGQNIT